MSLSQLLELNRNEKTKSNHLQANDRRGVMVNV